MVMTSPLPAATQRATELVNSCQAKASVCPRLLVNMSISFLPTVSIRLAHKRLTEEIPRGTLAIPGRRSLIFPSAT